MNPIHKDEERRSAREQGRFKNGAGARHLCRFGIQTVFYREAACRAPFGFLNPPWPRNLSTNASFTQSED